MRMPRNDDREGWRVLVAINHLSDDWLLVRYGWLSALMTGKGWRGSSRSPSRWWPAAPRARLQAPTMNIFSHQTCLGGEVVENQKIYFQKNYKMYAAQVKRDTQLNGSDQIRSDSSMELNSIGWISCAPVNDRTRDLLLGFGSFGRWPFGFYKDFFWNLPNGQYKLLKFVFYCSSMW